MLQSREIDGKCGEIFWSGHEGEKLTKQTRKKKSNIDKQNKQQTKKKASNLSVA